MPSHLSTIGFHVETPEDFAQLAKDVSDRATAVPVKGGRYLRWRGGAGEELWLQLNSRQEVIGMNPHFSGQSRINVGIVGRVTRADDTKLDGALHAWASPDADSPQDGEYPFVFDMPDAAVYSDLEVPGIAEAQVAAFAHEVEFYASETDFSASQQGDGPRFASRSFIPSGLFLPEGKTDDSPTAHAVFTGQVLQAETSLNPLSKARFWWALVDTLGGKYDVVIDPAILAHPPVIGGFLTGTFWLSGRLLSYPRKKKSWFGQLLGGAG